MIFDLIKTLIKTLVKIIMIFLKIKKEIWLKQLKLYQQ